jgi:hypothetical protein
MSSTAIVHQCSLPFPFTPAPHVDTAPETFAPFNQYPLSFPFVSPAMTVSVSIRFAAIPAAPSRPCSPGRSPQASCCLTCKSPRPCMPAGRAERALPPPCAKPTHHQCNLRPPWDRQCRTARSLPVAVHISSQEDLHAVRRAECQ